MIELMWEGKYENGKKCAPVRVALPFQDVETVNENMSDRAHQLDLFRQGQPGAWRNRLIWGDKKYVLPSLLPEFGGKVKLIYIDPPFATGDNFTFTTQVEGEELTKTPGALELKAYRDIWGKGLDSYARWFYDTAVLLYDLLAENGSMYVHCDYRVNSLMRLVLDEIFGPTNFKNEVVWRRSLPHNDPKKYGATHDTILFYAKSENYVFNRIYTEQSDEYKLSHYSQVDEQGRRYQLQSLSASGPGPARMFNGRLMEPPKGTHWRYSQERIDDLLAKGLIVFTKTGQPRYKRFLEESKGSALQSMWTDVNPINSQAEERLDYPTQKPEALLERIIRTSSNEGDLVLDCFAGSGTTAAVAEKLGRRWITADFGRFAIHTTRKRLLAIPEVKPFVVQNLGLYERQHWQAAEFGDDQAAQARQQAYTDFILKLYGARPYRGLAYIHGLKAGRAVHVGGVDAPVTRGDVRAAAAEWQASVGQLASASDRSLSSGLDLLGWDFAFDLNEIGKQEAAAAGLDIRYLQIPREIMEKAARDQGDIRFFELAALDVTSNPAEGHRLLLTINNFLMPPGSVTEELRADVGNRWQSWIDYWAVDWNHQGDTFHNQWQSYRTKRQNTVQTQASYTYDAPGRYHVLIKVIDVLGNDTTKLLEVEVA